MDSTAATGDCTGSRSVDNSPSGGSYGRVAVERSAGAGGTGICGGVVSLIVGGAFRFCREPIRSVELEQVPRGAENRLVEISLEGVGPEELDLQTGRADK